MRREWSEADETFLRENYQTMTTKALAEKLERSEQAIRSKIRRMGLEGKGRGGARPRKTPAATAKTAPEEESFLTSWMKSADRRAVQSAAEPTEALVFENRRELPFAALRQIEPQPLHANLRCRVCGLVDGYTPAEDTCRHCGARLYRIV